MKAVFKIKGMHCVSCAMNIDGSLEEIDGVIKSETSYVKAETKVEYDETRVSLEKLIKGIKILGYEAIRA